MKSFVLAYHQMRSSGIRSVVYREQSDPPPSPDSTRSAFARLGNRSRTEIGYGEAKIGHKIGYFSRVGRFGRRGENL